MFAGYLLQKRVDQTCRGLYHTCRYRVCRGYCLCSRPQKFGHVCPSRARSRPGLAWVDPMSASAYGASAAELRQPLLSPQSRLVGPALPALPAAVGVGWLVRFFTHSAGLRVGWQLSKSPSRPAGRSLPASVGAPAPARRPPTLSAATISPPPTRHAASRLPG